MSKKTDDSHRMVCVCFVCVCLCAFLSEFLISIFVCLFQLKKKEMELKNEQQKNLKLAQEIKLTK